MPGRLARPQVTAAAAPFDSTVLTIRKLFPGHGLFRGQVTRHFPAERLFTVRYEDGDTANRRARFLRAIVLLQRRVHISHRRVPARNLAAVVGQAIATYPVRGIKAYSATRYLIHALRPASTTQNFDTLVHVPARARRELQQWATWLHARSFAPMQPRVPAISHVLHVDASASGLGVVVTGDASSELIGTPAPSCGTC